MKSGSSNPKRDALLARHRKQGLDRVSPRFSQKTAFIESELPEILKQNDFEMMGYLAALFDERLTVLGQLSLSQDPAAASFMQACVARGMYTQHDVDFIYLVCIEAFGNAMKLAIKVNSLSAVQYLIETCHVYVNIEIKHDTSAADNPGSMIICTPLDLLEYYQDASREAMHYEEDEKRQLIRAYLIRSRAKRLMEIQAFSAIARNHPDALTQLLSQGLSPNLCELNGDSLMQRAARLGCAEIILCLYRAGAQASHNLDTVLSPDANPLVIAASQGYYPCVRAILLWDGHTLRSHILLKTAIEKAIGRDANKIKGAILVQYALHHIVLDWDALLKSFKEEKHSDCIRDYILSLNGVEFESVFKQFYASMVGKHYPCDTWLMEKLRRTLASSHYSTYRVIQFAEKMELNFLVNDLMTETIKARHAKTAIDLLHSGFDARSRLVIEGIEVPVLVYAATYGLGELVDKLLYRKADVNAATGRGNTALMAAVSNRHADCAKILIKGGANLTLLNDSGESVLTLAVSKGDSPCFLKVLRAHVVQEIYAKTAITDMQLSGELNRTDFFLQLAVHVGLYGGEIEYKAVVDLHYKMICKNIVRHDKHNFVRLFHMLCRFSRSLDSSTLVKLADYNKPLINALRLLENIYPLKLQILCDIIFPESSLGYLFYYQHSLLSSPSIHKGDLKDAVDILKEMDISVIMQHALDLLKKEKLTREGIYFLLRAVTGKKLDEEAQFDIVRQLGLMGQDELILRIQDELGYPFSALFNEFEASIDVLDFAEEVASPSPPPAEPPPEPVKSFKQLYKENSVFSYTKPLEPENKEGSELQIMR